MTRAQALAILAAHREELAAFGLRRLALFGSVARDEAGSDSDVDVLVEFEGEPTFKKFAGLCDRLEEWLRRPVDLATPNMIRPFMRETVEKDAVAVTALVPGLECSDELISAALTLR